MMKWKTIKRFFGWYTEKEWFERTMEQSARVYEINKELTNDLWTAKTSTDKPSAASSYTYSKARNRCSDFEKDDCNFYSVRNTNSMEPAIDSNSLIIGEPINDYTLGRQAITVGDIMIYESKYWGKIIHRIIKIVNKGPSQYYIFKGDNNEKRDYFTVKQDQLVSRYVGQIQLQKTNSED